MYSNRIVRTKVSADFQSTYSNSFKRPQFHTQTGSISPCRVTADNFYTSKPCLVNQIQTKVEEKILKKSQLDTFVHEIEKLNEILKKKVSIIEDLTKQFNQSEARYQDKNQELSNTLILQQKQQKLNDEQQNKINELLLTVEQLRENNTQQQQELESLYSQIEQYNKESQKFKDALKNSQTLCSEQEVKQLKMENNSQKQEITRLQIQLLEEKKEQNSLKLQLQELHNQENQQSVVDNQKQQIAQLRKTINLLEQNIADQFQSENQYSLLLQNFNQFKEQQKEQENKLSKAIKIKENEINDLQDHFKSQQVQLEQSNLLVISLQHQNEKLKSILKAKIDDTEIKKFELDTVQQPTQPLSQTNKQRKHQKEGSGTPKNHNSQHQQLNFIKEQLKMQMPFSTQNFEKDLNSYKNKMSSPSNIRVRQEGNSLFNKKVF